MSMGAELGQYFCASTRFEKFRIFNGVEAPTRPPGSASGADTNWRQYCKPITWLIMTKLHNTGKWRPLRRAWRRYVPPLLQMSGHGGHREQNSKEETDQTVLTVTKALTKTTNCTFKAKKWRGTTKKIFSGASRRIGAPTFAPHRCPPLSLQRKMHNSSSPPKKSDFHK